MAGSMAAATRRKSPIGVQSPRLNVRSCMHQPSSDTWTDPVIEFYKRDVDRTLLRQNLRLSPEDRVLKLQDFVRFLTEIRDAGKNAGLGR